MGIYLYLDSQKADVESIRFLPIVSLVIFIATYCVGWGPLPWTVMGEMFASNVKSKASGITVSICWLVSFFITKFANDLQEKFGNYMLFWLFAVFCVASVIFTILVLPETKGKSLQQIQNELNGVHHSEIPEFGDVSKHWKQYYDFRFCEDDLILGRVKTDMHPSNCFSSSYFYFYSYSTYT